jgi:hypothetical protein
MNRRKREIAGQKNVFRVDPREDRPLGKSGVKVCAMMAPDEAAAMVCISLDCAGGGDFLRCVVDAILCADAWGGGAGGG